MTRSAGLRTGLGFFWCVAAATTGAAQSGVPEKLTLSDAVRIAVDRHPCVAAARNNVEIARADLLTASRRPNPAMTFNAEGYP